MRAAVLRASDRVHLHRFCSFPEEVYRVDSQLRVYETRKFYEPVQCGVPEIRAEPMLAMVGGNVRARAALIRNRRHESKFADGAAFFGYFDALDDADAVSTILRQLEDDARALGYRVLRGPVCPDMNHYPGIQVSGFDNWRAPLTTYNKPYYGALLESAGYVKAMDLLGYELVSHPGDTPFAARVEAVPLGSITVRPVRWRSVAADFAGAWSVYRSAFHDNWCEVPVSKREFLSSALQLFPFASPGLVQVAEWNGEIVGFALAIPELGAVENLSLSCSKLLPIIRDLMKMRNATHVRVPLLGVSAQARNRGVEAHLIRNLWMACIAQGARTGELSWILETNERMLRPLRRIGAAEVKRWRIYEKKL